MVKVRVSGAKLAWQRLVGGPGYMGISIHSRNHRGECLAAMVNWANTQGQFTRMCVGISDTLNRHSYLSEDRVSLNAAFALSSENGDNWLKENSEILDILKMPYQIVRWSHWLENHADEVKQNRELFVKAYDSNLEFRASVNADIDAFIKRRSKQGDVSVPMIDKCLDYLIEELAVYSVILKEFPAPTVYPGKQLNCFAYLRKNNPASLPTAISSTGFIRLSLHGFDSSKTMQQPQALRHA